MNIYDLVRMINNDKTGRGLYYLEEYAKSVSKGDNGDKRSAESAYGFFINIARFRCVSIEHAATLDELVQWIIQRNGY